MFWENVLRYFIQETTTFTIDEWDFCETWLKCGFWADHAASFQVTISVELNIEAKYMQNAEAILNIISHVYRVNGYIVGIQFTWELLISIMLPDSSPLSRRGMQTGLTEAARDVLIKCTFSIKWTLIHEYIWFLIDNDVFLAIPLVMDQHRAWPIKSPLSRTESI